MDDSVIQSLELGHGMESPVGMGHKSMDLVAAGVYTVQSDGKAKPEAYV